MNWCCPAGERESGRYGETILKLLELSARPAATPGLMGILEDKAQMRRRIRMIANFKQRPRWSVLAALLLLAVGLVTLTDAQTEKPDVVPAQKDLTEEKTNVDVEFAMRNYQATIAAYDKDRQQAATAVFHLGDCFGSSEKPLRPTRNTCGSCANSRNKPSSRTQPAICAGTAQSSPRFRAHY